MLKSPRTLTLTLIMGALIVGCIAYGSRVADVNAQAFKLDVDAHPMRAPFELSGSFAEHAYENTDGYKVEVTGARVMSCDQYVSRFAVEGEEPIFQPTDSTDRSSPTLVVLDIVITNGSEGGAADASDLGYLDSIGWSLVPVERPEMWLRVDRDLFNTSVPQINGAFQLAVAPGTSFTIHVPFSTFHSGAFPARSGDMYRAVLGQSLRDFRFTLTNVPVRHVVEVRAS